MKKPFLNGLLFVFLIMGFQQTGLAQSPSLSDPKKSLSCLITTDFYIVHLTAYQEPKKDSDKKRHTFERFCQELPEDGSSFLAIDFLDRDLRQLPVGMSVVELLENPEGGERIVGATLASTPAQTYKTGVAQIQANFPKPGHYALIASVGDDMFADKIQIPLRVGIGSEFLWSSLLPYLYLILLFLLAYTIVRFFIYRYNKKSNSQED
ncbi:MAG: hypothetical protein KAH20_03100 [Methylococcales bacterium]|nr:hypothetical protein [Methylococcales bacterium]